MCIKTLDLDALTNRSKYSIHNTAIILNNFKQINNNSCVCYPLWVVYAYQSAALICPMHAEG